MLSTAVKYGLVFLGGSIAAEMTYRAYNVWLQKQNRQKIRFLLVNLSSCCCLGRLRPECRNPHCSARIIERMVGFLDAAETSIRVAMYCLAYYPFKEALVRAHKRGVKVQVLVDERMFTENRLHDLEKIVPLRFFQRLNKKIHTVETHFILHHKIILIDADAEKKGERRSGTFPNGLFIGGSLNWTSTALTRNCENIMLTERCDIIDAYRAEFDMLYADSLRSAADVGY